MRKIHKKILLYSTVFSIGIFTLGHKIDVMAENHDVVAASIEGKEELDYILGRPMTEAEIQVQREITNQNLMYTGYVEDPYAPENIKLNPDIPMVLGTMPSSYDSRSASGNSYITEVKNQNPYGTCWAFASIACVESSLVRQGYRSNSVDLSEAHLIYFSNYSAPDVLGNDYQDSSAYTGSESHLLMGGNTTMAYNALASWKGAVEETIASYENVDKGLAQSTEMAYLNDSVHIQGFYYIDKRDVDAIKSAIINYGAVSTSYYANNSYMNYDTAAYYCDTDITTNHAITIVGWDDNYSKENFYIKPSVNGAWLVKNSWGKSWGDEGYFWLSYEDASIYKNMAVFEAQPSDNYDNNYQYDFAMGNAYISAEKVASVFEVKANEGAKEALKAVAIDLCYSSNVGYSIQIYKNLQDMSDPTSGTPVLSKEQTGETTLAGYYTIPLEQNVVLEQGDVFSVVFSLESLNSANSMPYVTLETSVAGDRMSVASAQSYQSYIDFGGNNWSDIGAIYKENLRIKAFTDNLEEISIKCTGVELNKSNADIYVGEKMDLSAKVLPENASNKEVVWKTGNSEVATVDKNGRVTGIAEGTTSIIVRSMSGNYSASCEVTVKNVKVTGIALDKTAMIMEPYESYQLRAIVEPDNATDKSLIWNSSNTDVAVVNAQGQVRAYNAGSTIITATTKDGNYTAECKVTVEIPVTDIYFAYDGIKFVRESFPLSYLVVYPTQATNKELTWTSSEPDIVSVDNEGKIFVKSMGTATITATAASGASNFVQIEAVLPFDGYIGNINSELISFDLKQAGNGAYYLTGQIVVVEWVDGISTVPKDTPIMVFKSTDGTEEIEVFVTPTGTNTYYFDRFIEGLSADKEYVFEIASGTETNYSPNRSMNVSLATSPQMPAIKNLGKIGKQKISYYQAVNGELRLYQKNSTYVGNINSELIKTELVKGPNGNYVSGQIVVVEWENGVSTVPFETPIMYFKSTDGTESLPVFVTPTGTNTYYFDRSLSDMDTSKEYVFTIASGDSLNVSPYKSMIVTTAAMTNKEGLLWQSDTQYVRYRTDANTGELRVYAVDKQ